MVDNASLADYDGLYLAWSQYQKVAGAWPAPPWPPGARSVSSAAPVAGVTSHRAAAARRPVLLAHWAALQDTTRCCMGSSRFSLLVVG